MSLNTVAVTNLWVQVATGISVITIAQAGQGNLMFNETGSDVNALGTNPEAGEQFLQTESKATFARSDGAGWILRLDGVL